MNNSRSFPFLFLLVLSLYGNLAAQNRVSPDKIKFVRQGVRRLIFDAQQRIPLAALNPREVIGMSAMYPITHYLDAQAEVRIVNNQLSVQSGAETQTGIWFGGFNPFATYTIDLASCTGEGEIGFEFSDALKAQQFFVTIRYQDERLVDVHQKVMKEAKVIVDESIATEHGSLNSIKGKLILQMLGSGLTLYAQGDGLPIPIGQSAFNQYIDLRQKHYIHTFQSSLYLNIKAGQVLINQVESALSSGMGLADIRAITYEDGEPMLDQGRLWYTMSMRGRALPHHLQGVFSLDPTVFDIKFEGVILFDRNDGLLRNEVASHIFYDRRDHIWRGLTTGFSAFANPEEEKQLLAVESERDPRFGFSVMRATPFGIVGDIEDPHILFDAAVAKWRILTCENHDGYKAVMLESDDWNKGYQRIAGPVKHNATGTSIQKIGGVRYCFSGSQDRQIHIYTYPELDEAGTLTMDLPPWDEESGTRVWPNVVQLPEGYPFRYVALMMDRFNYPGLEGPHWSYGALYLFHGFDE
ncbi:MAG: hypothetical protein RIG62_25195 [Cyclobacteriaceae bacterium]